MRAKVHGPALPSATVEELRSLGVVLVAADGAPARGARGAKGARTAGAALPALVTGRALPRRLPGAPWLWVPPGEPPLAEAARSLLTGADAVIPLDGEGAVASIAAQLRSLAARQRTPEQVEGFPATSLAARRVLSALERAAQTSMAVLLTGETGTGKDVAAHQLHAWSPRAAHRFVPINCAAMPNELIEGELFGYVRGAFSGAVADYDGQLQAAAGGTVFLDEVDDTPKTLQVKLLRVLEDHVVSRLGENKWRPVDFRVVAATNRDLRALVRRGEFGDDLYQRLAIVQIQLPPLRDRVEDIPGLAVHFIERFYRDEPAGIGASAGGGFTGESKPRVVRVSSLALAALRRYPWPGNIRELRNVVFQALVGKRAGDEILLSDLPEPVIRGEPEELSGAADSGGGGGGEDAVVQPAAVARALARGSMNLRAAVDELERVALRQALARSGGSPTGAARLLGEVGRGRARDPGGTVRAMMRRHGMTAAPPGDKSVDKG